MPAADAAWLHMDRAANPIVVNALLWFGEPLDWERTREVFAERLVERFPRFRQRVTDPLGRPAFEDCPGFDLDQHMHRLALPAPGDQRALEELVSDLITPPLDRSRPLWHAYLIEGFGGGCALLMRIHHCIADGIALARVLLSLTDEAPDAGIEPPPAEAANEDRAPLRSLLRSGAGALSATRRITETAVHEGIESIVHPSHAAHLTGVLAQDAGTLAKLLAAPADADTVLTQPLHGTRRVAWSTPFPLERIKDAGRRSEGTINDVLVTAVTGALRECLEQGERLPEDVHVMVPFNLRPLDQPVPRELGNDFALILPGAARRHPRSARPAESGEDPHGRGEALARGPDLLRHPQRRRPDSRAGRAPPDRVLHEQGERGGDQRSGAERARPSRGSARRRRAGLGALLGEHRPDREHLQLRR